MNDAGAGGEAAPKRVAGRWGEALLAPEAPRDVERAVLAALGGSTGLSAPPAAKGRHAWGPVDLNRPTPASAVTADEPASTTRLRCPADAPPAAVPETAGTYSAVIPPTFPPQAHSQQVPAAAEPPPVARADAAPLGSTAPAGAPGLAGALGPAGASGPEPAGSTAPAGPDAPECPSGAETGVWIDPDDLPMSVEPGADALADGEAPRTAPARSADPAPSGPPPEPIPRYPEPEPGSGRRRRRAAAPPASGPAPPRAAEGDGGPGSGRRSSTAPLPPGGAPAPEEAAQAASSGSSGSSGATGTLVREAESVPMITSAICVAGHANPPDAQVCLCCSAPLSGRLIPVPRPVLAMITLPTGTSVPVRGDLVVGRAPRPQPGGEPGAFLLEVPSPAHLVSRSHLLITTAGWNVLARDLGSNNGTVLLRPGFPAVLLAAALPTPLYVGDLLDVGDGVMLRVEPPI
ncbi:FHA domain-containing protein [Actinomyces israelii]|uniref:hypothetical protein n=1 Tax=Actinomyces israelii TaxID=1659 RepID=UPI00255342CA|nr:hypothetical protein [Actinomyces israelii]WKR20624.1 hypothetical protein AIF0345_0507 [Actinomyces israelii]